MRVDMFKVTVERLRSDTGTDSTQDAEACSDAFGASTSSVSSSVS